MRGHIANRVCRDTRFLCVLITTYLFSGCPHRAHLRCIGHFCSTISAFGVSLPAPVVSNIHAPAHRFDSYMLVRYNSDLSSVGTASDTVIGCISRHTKVNVGTKHVHTLNDPVHNNRTFRANYVPFCGRFRATIGSYSRNNIHNNTTALFCPV